MASDLLESRITELQKWKSSYRLFTSNILFNYACFQQILLSTYYVLGIKEYGSEEDMPGFMPFTFLVGKGKVEHITHRIVIGIKPKRQSRAWKNWEIQVYGGESALVADEQVWRRRTWHNWEMEGVPSNGSMKHEIWISTAGLVFKIRKREGALCRVKRQFGVVKQVRLSWRACHSQWARPLGPPGPPADSSVRCQCRDGRAAVRFHVWLGTVLRVPAYSVRLPSGKHCRRVALTLT